MKKLSLAIVAGFLLFGSGKAQITAFPWTEGFESGVIPSGWTQEYVSGSEDWFVAGGMAHSGTYFALFYGDDDDVTKLVTPRLDLSGLTNPILKFWHLEPWFDNEQDTLKVYYKSSSSGVWNLLGAYSSGTFSFTYTEEIIQLPNASNDYYIAFEGVSTYEIGIALDDITVMDFTNYVDVEVASIITPVSGMNLTSTEQVTVLLKNNGSDPITGFSLKLELDGTTVATETYTGTIPSLSQDTYIFTATVDLSILVNYNYTIKVTATIPNDQDTTNDSKSVTVCNYLCSSPVSIFPWTEGFEGTTFPPACWTSYDIDGGGEQWKKNTDVNSLASLSHSGTGSAVHVYNCYSSPEEGWLVTPQLAIPAVENYVLEFRSFNIDPEDYEYNGVWVSTTGNNPTSSSFTEIKQLSGYEVSDDWKKIMVPLGAFAGQDIYIGFKYAGYCADVWVIDDIKIFDFSNYVDVEVASIITPVSGMNLTSTEQVKVLLKNNGIDPLTGFSLELKLNGTTVAAETYTGTIPSLSQAEYTFTATVDLSAQGNYTITVIATAANDQDTTNDSKTKTVSNAICSPITSFPWTEGFEGAIFPPACWTSYDIDGRGEQWRIYYSFSHSGTSSAVHFYDCDSPQEGWLVTPPLAIPAAENYVLEFWSSNVFPEDYEYNGVWVSTTGNNPTFSSFTEIKQLSGGEISGNWKKITIPLNNYAGRNIYIGFKYAGYCADAWLIDDIKVFSNQNNVASLSPANDVKIYPNPSNGTVNVVVSENSVIKLTDVLGKVIDTYTVNGNSVLSFTQQAAGLYFLQVESNGKKSVHKVVIK